MRNRFRAVTVLLLAGAAALSFILHLKDRAEAAARPQQSSSTTGTMPGSDDADSHYGPSFAYLAWNLFLRVMEPKDGAPTFESWTEQCQLNSSMAGCPSAERVAALAKLFKTGKVRLLHAGVGDPARRVTNNDCSTMIRTPLEGYPAPRNLAPGAIYCEEVYISPAEAAFVKSNLTTLVDQQLYGKLRNGTINFPGTETNDTRVELDSVEVKLDWVPSHSYLGSSFRCPDPAQQLYTETINGTCYALAAVHITSKVMPNWLWATFEPRNAVTNPNRCDPQLYGPCFDPWGTTSRDPYGKSHPAQQSPELRQAMAQVHLAPALNNYFLTGVQTQFIDPQGKPIQLGNSFIEFNQGVAPGKSSCITCHQYAAFDGKQTAHHTPENNFGKPLHGWPSIGYACNQNQTGNCFTAAADGTTQDFSWMLGLMPFSSSDQQAAFGGAVSAAAHTLPLSHTALASAASR